MILFLGSGVSLESKLPGVAEIKAELFKTTGDIRIQKLLALLVDLDTDYLEHSAPYKDSSGRVGYTGQLFRAQTTYEDLFYLIDQIVVNGEGRKADLTAGSFVDLVRLKGRAFLRGRTKLEQAVDLHKLAIATRRFIESKVASLLRSDRVKGLDLILEMANSPSIKKLNIVTLNHDTLVEQLLSAKGINFADGFGKPDGDIRWFKDQFSDDQKVRIIKLHGSISWWKQAGNDVIQPVVITENKPGEWRNAKGEIVENIRKVPSFLTGVSKVYSYNQGIYADQHYRFLQLLHKDNRMVMSGYGWGDIPINFQLQNWLARGDQNSLLLLHQDPTALVEGSLELRHVYNKYVNNRKIRVLKKWLSDASINEIGSFL